MREKRPMKIIKTQTTESLRLKVLFAQSKISKQKKNDEMCLAPIFLPQLATEVFFSFNGQILIYFDSLTGKLSTKLS